MSTPTPSDERLAELLRIFNERAPLARTFGLRLHFDAQHRPVVELPYNPALNHSMNGVHGGVYMTLLDIAGWFAAATAHEVGIWVATSELTTHLLKPVFERDLRAIGRLIQSGRRLDIAEAHLYDAEGQLVGHGVGTFAVLPHLRTDRST